MPRRNQGRGAGGRRIRPRRRRINSSRTPWRMAVSRSISNRGASRVPEMTSGNSISPREFFARASSRTLATAVDTRSAEIIASPRRFRAPSKPMRPAASTRRSRASMTRSSVAATACAMASVAERRSNRVSLPVASASRNGG